MDDDIGKLLDEYFSDNTVIVEMLANESETWGDENVVFYTELPYILIEIVVHDGMKN